MSRASVMTATNGHATTTTDTYRLGAFISSGMDGEKAEALAAFVRNIEDHTEPELRARRLLEVVKRLTDEGMDRYLAFTTLMCHPSDHEPYGAIGADYLTKKEGTPLADDPQPN